MMKKFLLFIIFSIIPFSIVFSQNVETSEVQSADSSDKKGNTIITAQDFFNELSENYASITDYEAEVTITQNKDVMKGLIFYKTPELLRIDFTQPDEQVMVVDNEKLVLYVPKYHVVMSQKLKKTGASLATKEGLALLKKNYSVAYLDSADFVPLEDKSTEMVKKLKFVWRVPDKGFRQIEMSVDQNNLIRRMIGISTDYKEVRFDFINIKINQDIPEARFKYDNPADANTFENFLFGVE